MNRAPHIAVAVASPALLLLATMPHHRLATVRAGEAPITYSRHIAPILYQNCSTCHHSGGSGPFPLTSYADAKRWGSTLAEVTRSRYMPPWLPEPGHGDFAGTRRLSAEQIALIQRWVATSMAEGNPAEAPKPPVYTGDWPLGPPDLILEVDSPTQVPASGTDLFRNFILPVPLTQTRWVRAMQIQPGSPQVVHHANLLIDRTASLRRLHPAEWRAGIPGMDITVDSGERFDPDSHFLDWKPDSTSLEEAPGMAWRLDPGNDLVLNMHLKPTGKVETVRARIGLYFAAEPATQLPILLQLEHDAALDIPAGDPDFVVEDQLTLPEAVDVLAIYPHAHYLGKRLEGWATLPTGQRKDLILIPHWDIDRQSIYHFAAAVALPRGSVVHMRYSYDNSVANPKNPNSPPIRVTEGNRSVDEMGHLWLQVLPHPAPDATGDARAPLLRAWMENRLRKSPGDPTALFNLASLDLSTGAYTSAVAQYRLALKARPDDPRTATALGSALNAADDSQAAQTEFAAALRQDPGYTDARFNLATLELQHGDYAAAEREFRTLLATQPNDAAALSGLGSTQLATDRGEAARLSFTTALQHDPNNFEAHYNLASLDAAAGNVAAALDHLTRAAMLRPADPDTHSGLADLYAQLGQLPDAIREQQTVVALNPVLPDTWNNLGALHARHGDRDEARRDFQHALALDSQNQAARANLARLQ